MNHEAKNPEHLPAPVNREFYLRTDRLYDDYVKTLSLADDTMANAGVIVDVGSGFASFVKEANQRFRSSGTRTIGLDIEYKHMAGTQGSLDTFSKNGGVFTPGYGKLERYNNSNDPELQQNVYQEMFDDVTGTGDYLTASFDAIPLADESVGLLIAHNSILQSDFSLGGLASLPEVMRVIKPTGEARLLPSYFQWGDATEEVVSEPIYMSGDKQELIDFRRAHILDSFFKLQETGAHFWNTLSTTENEGSKTYTNALIITRDDHVPSLGVEIGSLIPYQDLDDETQYYSLGLASFKISKTPTGYKIDTERIAATKK